MAGDTDRICKNKNPSIDAMIPNYRNIHKVKNPPGTPRDKLKCEYCHDPLTKENRSVISNMVISLDHNLYQLCKACRQRFYGNVSDSVMLKWAYKIAKGLDDDKKTH